MMEIRDEFLLVENPMDYVDEIIEVNGTKVCIANCEDWFEQYPLNEEGEIDNDYEYATEWYVPYKLLPDCDLYMNKYISRCGTEMYHGIVLGTPTETYLDDFASYDECLKWLVGDE